MSAAIFVALALGWAIYLVPKALKRHDTDARTRSIDTFSSKLRVLARREPIDSRSARLVTAEASPRPAGSGRQVVSQRPSRSAAAARVAARRRRRILAMLLLVDVVVGALSVAGVLLPWAAGIPLSVTVLYLVLCRVLVRRERRRTRARSRQPAPRSAGAAEPTGSVEPPLRNAQGFAQITETEDTAAISVPATVDGASLWDPLPVTLPTYVGKDVAPRSVRTIDLDDPTISNSGRDAGDSRLVAEAAASSADVESQVESAGTQHAV